MQPKQQRFCPPALAGEHRTLAVVEVQMPECADVFDLEAAHLQARQAVTGGDGAGARAAGSCLAEHRLRLQIAPDRGIRRQ